MPVVTRTLDLAAAALLVSAPVFAGVCDYKPSKLAGDMVAAASSVGGGAAGAGLRAVGYYALVHSAPDMSVAGAAAAGSSAASTMGIIAGTSKAGAAISSILMAPAAIIVGAVTVIAVGGFEGACYFQIERVDDPFQVRGIVESIAENNPGVAVRETKEGPVLVVATEQGDKSFLIRNLYVADGNLMHRDWARNTNLGSVAYVRPEGIEDR